MSTNEKNTADAGSEGGSGSFQRALFRSREERLAAGKALRETLPRNSHAVWTPSAGRRDPIDILEESNQDRLPELVPIRYGRMLRSPFTFLRGSAGLMAYDLATTPNTGLRVQACGDCHLMNFGLFATPERNLVFDLNDFDETLPAPWEWDLKRLAVSFAVAARDNKLSDADARETVLKCVCAYREHLREYSRMSPLEVWYTRLDMESIIAMSPDEKAKKLREQPWPKKHGNASSNTSSPRSPPGRAGTSPGRSTADHRPHRRSRLERSFARALQTTSSPFG